MTLHDHIASRFEVLAENFRRESVKAGKSGDAESIHDVRVASRRIVETIRVFDDVLDRSLTMAAAKRLRRWMKASNSVRDLDVIIELAQDTKDSRVEPLVARWQKKRETRWRKGKAKLQQAGLSAADLDPGSMVMSAKRSKRDSIWDLTLSAGQNASLSLPFLMERYVLVGNGIQQGVAGDSDYHAFRLRTKRIRYTMEAFEEVYPKQGFKELLATLKSFQQNLGSLHDCAVAVEVAKKTASHREELVEAASVLDGDLSGKADQLREDWHRRWNLFARTAELRAAVVFLREAPLELGTSVTADAL